VKRRCFDPQEFPAILALPPADPRRRHLETCLHCRALLHAYTEFMDPSDPEAFGDLAAVDAELANRLAAIVEGGVPAPRADAPTGRAWSCRPRAVLAVAVVLAVCAGIFLARDAVLLRDSRLPAGSAGLERGGSDGSDGSDGQVETGWTRDGDLWRLSWPAVAGAESTVVVFYDGGLHEVGRSTATATAPRVLARDAVPAGAEYLQLLFVAAGDTVARSAILAARPGGS